MDFVEIWWHTYSLSFLQFITRACIFPANKHWIKMDFDEIWNWILLKYEIGFWKVGDTCTVWHSLMCCWQVLMSCKLDVKILELAFWYILVTFWYILEQSGKFWYILVHSGTGKRDVKILLLAFLAAKWYPKSFGFLSHNDALSP